LDDVYCEAFGGGALSAAALTWAGVVAFKYLMVDSNVRRNTLSVLERADCSTVLQRFIEGSVSLSEEDWTVWLLLFADFLAAL
jgi:hypothetical protein